MVDFMGDALDDFSHTSDVLVAEMIINGRMIYIDTLCTGGVVVTPLNEYNLKPAAILPRLLSHAHVLA